MANKHLILFILKAGIQGQLRWDSDIWNLLTVRKQIIKFLWIN